MDCSLFYNINGNNLATEKLKRHKEFVYAMRNIDSNKLSDEIIDKIYSIIHATNCNKDRIALVNAIPTKLNGINNYLMIFNVLVYEIATNIDSEDCEDSEVCNSIKEKFKKYELLVSSNEILRDDEKIDSMMNSIGHKVCTIERLCRKETGDYVWYVSPKTLHSVASMTEAQAIGTSDSMIKSSADPKGSFTSIGISNAVNPSEYLMSLFNEDDHDYFIHSIHKLYDYLVSLRGNIDDEHTNAFIEALNYVFSKVLNDITGKEILIDTISKCDQLLTDIVPTSTDYLDNINEILKTFESLTDKINSEYSGGTTDLLDEMGLGYIYDILPKNESAIDDNIDEIVTSLNESAETLDIISILNESIKDNIKEYRDKRKERREKEKAFKEKQKDEKYEIFDKTKDERVDISKRRQNDDYDLERDKKRDKYDDRHELKKKVVDDTYGDFRQNRDDKYDIKQQGRQDKYDMKQQKKQDKYDFKRQKKLDKYEQKKSNAEEDRQLKIERAEQKRQERLEARQRRRDETKVGINRWKTLELTNPNARKAANALRKVVKTGAVAGTAALAGLNPIFAGSTYLISSYVKDKSNPYKERRRYVDDLRQQIAEIDEKINMAEQRDEKDKKLALVKMKNKLETALKRCGHLEQFEADM